MINFSFFLLLVLALSSCASKKSPMSPEVSATDYWPAAPIQKEVTYEGGNGRSLENPIRIMNAENSRKGIAAEYRYIEENHGEKFKDWKPIGQSTMVVNGRRIDLVSIMLTGSNESITYHFDITEFYGK